MKITVVATGGTISSHLDENGWTSLDGHTLVDEVRERVAHLGVDVSVVDVATGPSSNLTVDDMIAISHRVRDLLDEGVAGVVVTHGTDTMELTAFMVQLVLGVNGERRPVVFTGSMRVHSHPQPDGPQNIADAIAVAADARAVGREVLVCLEGAIHGSDRIVKCDATSVDAFTSAPFAPIGHVRNGIVVFDADLPVPRPPARDIEPDVPLVTCYPGMQPDLVENALRDRRGAVLEVFGDLNVPSPLWGPIHQAWNDGALVVLASRPFTHTVRAEGLDMLGAVGAGGLTAQKARLATMAALGSCVTRDDAITFLHQHRLVFDSLDRSSTT